MEISKKISFSELGGISRFSYLSLKPNISSSPGAI